MVDVIELQEGILSDVCNFKYLTENSVERDETVFNLQSYALEPVLEKFDSDAVVVGFIVAVFPWNTYFENILPEGTAGVTVVIDDQCGDVFTHVINGANCIFLASAPIYTTQRTTVTCIRLTLQRYTSTGANTRLLMEPATRIRPRATASTSLESILPRRFELQFTSNKHIMYATVVVGIFAAITVLLVIYDRTVTSQQKALLDSANRIIGSLFTEAVHKQLMEQAAQDGKRSTASTLKDYLVDEEHNNDMPESHFTTNPIAELFPSTTVMFADIVGFTPWELHARTCPGIHSPRNYLQRV